MLAFIIGNDILDKFIWDGDISSVVSYIQSNPSKVNVESRYRLPLVSAVVHSKFSIIKFLLDKDANPMITQKDSSLNNSYIMDSCLSQKMLPVLELMVFHEKHGREVHDYLYSTYIQKKGFIRDKNIFPMLQKLLETARNYYGAGEASKLLILDRRISRHKKYLGVIGKSSDKDAISNLGGLINFLDDIRNGIIKTIFPVLLGAFNRGLNGFVVPDQEKIQKLMGRLEYSNVAMMEAGEYISKTNTSIKEFLKGYNESKINKVDNEGVTSIEIIRKMSDEWSSKSTRSSDASSAVDVTVADLLGLDHPGTTKFFSEANSQLRHRVQNDGAVASGSNSHIHESKPEF